MLLLEIDMFFIEFTNERYLSSCPGIEDTYDLNILKNDEILHNSSALVLNYYVKQSWVRQ